MAKLLTLFTLALVLSFSLSSAARRDSSFTINTGIKALDANVEPRKALEDESCEGVGKDECLMRRTLVDHLDYIYTQDGKN